MFYKENIDDDEFKESAFLTKKIQKEIPERGKNEVRGINAEKLDKIKKDLLPHMPARKRLFWNDLSINSNSTDT